MLAFPVDKPLELKETKLARGELVNKMNPLNILQRNPCVWREWTVPPGAPGILYSSKTTQTPSSLGCHRR